MLSDLAQAQAQPGQTAGQTPPAAQSAQRGAFGQRVDPDQVAPANRAERRAQERKGR